MSRREWILRGVYLGLWVLVVARVLSLLPPGGDWDGWNSDMAIALLQANDPVIDPFRFYYYGQDRLGAWPWLLMQAVRPWSGGGWTLGELLLWHTAWTCAACFPLLALHRAGGRVLAAAHAALMLLLPGRQVMLMFAPGHAFGWQTTAMLLAWWALEHLLTALARPEAATVRTVRWAAGASFFAALACWSSPTSGPMLLAFLSVWGLFLAVQLPTARARWRLLWGVLPVGLGILTEVVLRNRYHHFARKVFKYGYGTNLGLDTGHLGENLRMIGERLVTSPPGPGVLVGWLLGLVALAWLLRHARVLAAHAEPARLAALTVMFTAASVANTLLTVLVAHVRLNGHDPRYLVPTFVFGCLAAAIGGLFVLAEAPGLRRHVDRLGALGAAGLVLGGYVFARTDAPRDVVLERAQAVAKALAKQEPGLVLLGGYWDSYAVAALDPQRRIPALTFEGEYLRTPFWKPALQEGRGAWVLSRREEEPSPAPVPPWLFQYGTVLRLAEPYSVRVPPFQVARYENLTRATVPVRLEPAQGFNPCEVGSEVTVHFERPIARGLVLVGSRMPPTGIEAVAPGAEGLRVEGDLGVWRVQVRSARPLDRVTLRVRAGGEGERCDFHGAALVTGVPLDAAPR